MPPKMSVMTNSRLNMTASPEGDLGRSFMIHTRAWYEAAK
jgi:hypothetical protein